MQLEGWDFVQLFLVAYLATMFVAQQLWARRRHSEPRSDKSLKPAG
jgi:hypothetical protein